jgi:hypothetical protein
MCVAFDTIKEFCFKLFAASGYVMYFYSSTVDSLLVGCKISSWSVKIMLVSCVDCINLLVCLKHFCVVNYESCLINNTHWLKVLYGNS